MPEVYESYIRKWIFCCMNLLLYIFIFHAHLAVIELSGIVGDLPLSVHQLSILSPSACAFFFDTVNFHLPQNWSLILTKEEEFVFAKNRTGPSTTSEEMEESNWRQQWQVAHIAITIHCAAHVHPITMRKTQYKNHRDAATTSSSIWAQAVQGRLRTFE